MPYQLDLAARAFALKRSAVIADPGTGKTMIALAVACYAQAAGSCDIAVIICERSKLLDWKEETERATGLRPVMLYRGPLRDRMMRDENPRVLIMTYETARESILAYSAAPGTRKPAAHDGPLLRALAGRKVLLVWDEAGAKLKNRSSGTYKAQARLARALARTPGFLLMALTATPLERDYEQAFNMLRITGPAGYMPLVKDFDSLYVRSRDERGRPRFREDRMPGFAARAAPRILRKRKTDPDVRAQFPPKSEIFERAGMHADQARLYRLAEDLGWNADGSPADVPGLPVILRQIAGDPSAVPLGSSRLAGLLAGTLGPQLAACSSAKGELLASYLRGALDADLKSLVFTFFGQTVLPALAGRLRAQGMPVLITHGQMSAEEQQEQRRLFRESRGGMVLLSSDAGARGVNLPAAYVFEYEAAVTQALRTQRFDRASRLGSGDIPLTCITLVLEGTLERPLLKRALERNAQQDLLLGDDTDETRADGFITARDRRWMLACARKRKP